MPLILPDGTVYGVVGVELLTEYLQSKLPYMELDEDKAGTYFIVTTTDDALTDGVLSLRKTVTSGGSGSGRCAAGRFELPQGWERRKLGGAGRQALLYGAGAAAGV